ncbi:hypothetical protein [Burkholderia gladioli]|uniref:hypothetical protein n=1 Tax=Burkholderia gladioli TaxID=28095 RepID=UPI0016412DD1
MLVDKLVAAWALDVDRDDNPAATLADRLPIADVLPTNPVDSDVTDCSVLVDRFATA